MTCDKVRGREGRKKDGGRLWRRGLEVEGRKGWGGEDDEN